MVLTRMFPLVNFKLGQLKGADLVTGVYQRYQARLMVLVRNLVTFQNGLNIISLSPDNPRIFIFSNINFKNISAKNRKRTQKFKKHFAFSALNLASCVVQLVIIEFIFEELEAVVFLKPRLKIVEFVFVSFFYLPI